MICGATGSGKSTAILNMIQDMQQVVILDQQRHSTARAAYAIKSGILDDLDDPEKHVPFTLLPPETGIERDVQIEDFEEVLIGSRSKGNMDENPLIQSVVNMWCRLLPPFWTIKRGLRMFRFGDEFKEAIDLCTDEECRSWWLDQPMSPTVRDRNFAPAERILSLLGTEAIASRTYRGTNEFIGWIDQGYSFFAEGGQIIPQKALRLIQRTRLKQLNRYKSRGGKANFTIILEESEASGIIGPAEAKAVQLLRKTGVSFVYVCQEPHWLDDQVTQIILNNTNKMWFRADSQTIAEMAADDLMVMFQPYAIKETTEMLRVIDDKKYIDRKVVYFSPSEQHQLIQKWVMSLPVGAAFVRFGNRVRYVQFPKVDVQDPEQKRKKQTCLRETKSFSTSTTSTQSPLNKPSSQKSSHRTPSPLDEFQD